MSLLYVIFLEKMSVCLLYIYIGTAIIGAGTIAVGGIFLALQRFVPKEILDDAATIVQGLDFLLEDRTRKRERPNVFRNDIMSSSHFF
jgi:hypothetical protein